MTEVHEGPFWDRVAGKLPGPPGSARHGHRDGAHRLGAGAIRDTRGVNHSGAGRRTGRVQAETRDSSSRAICFLISRTRLISG